MFFLFFSHSICVLEEQFIFVMAQAGATLLGVRHPQFLKLFGMKADDVVPTFVWLNIFRVNICQYFVIGNTKHKLTRSSSSTCTRCFQTEASAAEVGDARRGGV